MKAALARLRRRPNGAVGMALLGAAAAAALLGAFYTPFDPLELDFTAQLAPPDARHWFGTDQYGRDVLSRILAAASVSLSVSLATTVCALLAGLAVGTLAGYLGGAIDRIAMLLVDALMAFPALLLALALIVALGPSRFGVVLALGAAFSPMVVRVVRSAVLSLREMEFVEASRVLGNGHLATLMRHVLPNCISPVTVLATSVFGHVLLAESALSFLGLGVPPPAPTWGGMLAESRHLVGRGQAEWLGLFPGLFLSASLLGVNLLGDALRDVLDPRDGRA